MDRNQTIHDLTILYMENSISLSKFKNPKEYALKYKELYREFESLFKSTQQPILSSTTVDPYEDFK